ncbi:MAG: hypothetical protein GVY19_06865 [Bacteroidetes bacterium]|jgi:uncharacterized protein YdeI (YjbR/CyaY-like superfamily)|nr:hypothetical protein [Bacteroidota bacterium]
MDKEYEKQLKENVKAWKYYGSLSPSVQKSCIHWVMSAKQEKTRLNRLKILIESSEKGEKIPPLKWGDKK